MCFDWKAEANLLRQWNATCIAWLVTVLQVVLSRMEKLLRRMKPCTHLSPALMPNFARAVSWMCISATAKW